MPATIRKRPKVRSKSDIVLSVTELDLGTYTTGGVTVTAKDLGLDVVYAAIVVIKIPSAAGGPNIYHYDRDVNKVLGYFTSGSQVSNGTNLSTNILQITAFGA